MHTATKFICAVCNINLVQHEVCSVKIWACPICTDPRIKEPMKYQAKIKKGNMYYDKNKSHHHGERYEVEGRRHTAHKNKRRGLLCAVALNVLFMSPIANAFTEEQAVHAIMGEARGEFGMDKAKKLKAMTMVGEAIRNRGTLKGVYGLKAKINEPEWVWKIARQAWTASATSRLTNGATHWEAVEKYGEPYWAKSMVKTAKFGSHTFMKERPSRKLPILTINTNGKKSFD